MLSRYVSVVLRLATALSIAANCVTYLDLYNLNPLVQRC